MSDPLLSESIDDIPPDPHADDELTEEDLFRMKELGPGSTSAGTAEQSIISIADSASNFEEHVGDEFDDDDVGDNFEEEEEDESNINPDAKIIGNWVFGRRRAANVELNKETVTVLHFPNNVMVPACPENENPAEWAKAFQDATVYLIGTAHFSKESQEDVVKAIELTQPDLVMVELCPGRISILSMDEETLLREASKLNTEKIITTIKQSGAVQGILHVLLLSMSAHLTRQLSMAPGGEFRAAHRAANKSQMCRLVLGDRPIQITLQRALGSLTFWQRLKFFWHVMMSHRTVITPEEVEKCKKRDLLEELLAEMAGDFPKLSQIFVEERDDYMRHALQSLILHHTIDKRKAWKKDTTAEWQPINIVAVVGIGHTPGIANRWDNSVNIEPLLEIPPPTMSALIIRKSIKYAFYGAIGYIVYRSASGIVKRFK